MLVMKYLFSAFLLTAFLLVALLPGFAASAQAQEVGGAQAGGEQEAQEQQQEAQEAGAQEQRESFGEWLEGVRVEAREAGISEAALAALDDIEAPVERVLELDGSQPEFVQTFSRYLGLRVNPAQIERGRLMMRLHGPLLAEVQEKYGVQPHYLMAFWALETNFGGNTGGFSVLQALATLAYDPRRADFFRRELLTALRIIDQGHISPARMNGSWAGAMGQLQFLPSVFYRFGVDGDGDGRIDIWDSLPDVFHSAANFLHESGWQGDERWGREVLLPAGFDYRLADGRSRKPLREWAALGITMTDGSALPVADMSAALVIPAGAEGPAFLAYRNYRSTMAYNPSIFYALTIGHLADRISGEGPLARMPAQEQAMSVADVRRLQEILTSLGYNTGAADGRVGRRTRAAIRAYQEAQSLPADGYPSRGLLEAAAATAGVALPAVPAPTTAAPATTAPAASADEPQQP